MKQFEQFNPSLGWIKKIPEEIAALDTRPLLGHFPSFPVEKFQEQISKIFEGKCSLQVFPFQWRSKDELHQDFFDPFFFSFALKPFEGLFYWIISKKDIKAILSLLFYSKEPVLDLDPDFEEGFLLFVTAELLTIWSEVNLAKELSPQFLGFEKRAEEPMLSSDILLSLSQKEFRGRILLSTKLQKEIRNHRFAERAISSSFSEAVDILVHVQGGLVHLTLEEWKTVLPGDFIALDRCTLKPEGKGTVFLALDGQPFYRGHVKEGKITIVKHPEYYEVVDMVSKFSKGEEKEEEEEIEPGEEFEEEEGVEEERVEEEEEEVSEVLERPVEEKAVEEEKIAIQPVQKEEAEELTKTDSLPLTVIVEVGRFQMALKEFISLQPGNLLNLDVRPDEGVDLVINGKCVAKGELMQIGDVLGVRILEIA